MSISIGNKSTNKIISQKIHISCLLNITATRNTFRCELISIIYLQIHMRFADFRPTTRQLQNRVTVCVTVSRPPSVQLALHAYGHHKITASNLHSRNSFSNLGTTPASHLLSCQHDNRLEPIALPWPNRSWPLQVMACVVELAPSYK